MLFGKTRLFRQYLESKWQDLYRVAYSWTRDQDMAADLVQETISRSLKHCVKFESKEHLRPWLYKVMANCWRDQLRKAKDTVDIDSLELRANIDIEHQHDINGLVLQVNCAMKELSPNQQEILSLVVLEGLSYEEISRALDIPVGTVMSRISRARSKLRETMQDIDITLQGRPYIWRVK